MYVLDVQYPCGRYYVVKRLIMNERVMLWLTKEGMGGYCAVLDFVWCVSERWIEGVEEVATVEGEKKEVGNTKM